MLSGFLLGGFALTAGTLPASATVTTLCKGYTACAKAGMSSGGYSSVSRTMYWRMYSGHNCTNYAAYRMVHSGLPNTRPWTGSGNATNWGSAMSRITNGTPSVGAVAWWRAGVRPAGSVGHVAYVERVVSASEIIVSQDSWGGDFSWARITRTSSGWPSGFVHFNDVRLVNTAAPAVKGVAKVGSALTAAPGTWSRTGLTFTYQWLQNGSVITGATGPSLTPKLAQQGKRITVRVTASSLGFATTSVVSSPTAAVQPGVIDNAGTPTIAGEPRVESVLTASSGTWTPAPDRLTYQWKAAGVPIQGATQPTLTVDPALVGKPLAVTVTAARTGYADVSVTSARTAPVSTGHLTLLAPPTVKGTARPGHTLTMGQPGVRPEPARQVEWLRGGRVVQGATGPTYRLTAAVLGSRVGVRVRLTRPGYDAMTTRTSWTPVVRATPVIKVTTQPGTRRLAVTARVTAPGVSSLDGVIRVRSRGKVLKEIAVRDGVATATVTGLPPGTRTFRFRLPTTDKVSSGVVARRIRIG
jgi:surface antigen